MTDPPKVEVFRGHLNECLQHLAQRFAASFPPGSMGAAKARKPIVDFCGVGSKTVHIWFTDPEASPGGETLLRLLCCLDMYGYHVIEFGRMPSAMRNFAELIGYQLITAVEATKLLGYSQTSTMYQVLVGEVGIGREREQRMWEYWKGKREELRRHKTEAYKRYALPRSLTRRKPRVRPVPTQEVVPASSDASRQQVEGAGSTTTHPGREVAVRMMEELLVLLDQGALAGVSVADLAVLRCDLKTIHALQVHLNGLSARIIVQAIGGRGT